MLEAAPCGGSMAYVPGDRAQVHIWLLPCELSNLSALAPEPPDAPEALRAVGTR